jgi:hypothetical protein
MKAAKRFGDLAKVIIFGLLVATFVFAPLGVVTVRADGGSTGQPGIPPADTTHRDLSIGTIPPADDSPLIESVSLTLLRFIVL